MARLEITTETERDFYANVLDAGKSCFAFAVTKHPNE